MREVEGLIILLGIVFVLYPAPVLVAMFVEGQFSPEMFDVFGWKPVTRSIWLGYCSVALLGFWCLFHEEQ